MEGDALNRPPPTAGGWLREGFGAYIFSDHNDLKPKVSYDGYLQPNRIHESRV